MNEASSPARSDGTPSDAYRTNWAGQRFHGNEDRAFRRAAALVRWLMVVGFVIGLPTIVFTSVSLTLLLFGAGPLVHH
jgi:hypothetical protein